jgi:hypothetical protein
LRIRAGRALPGWELAVGTRAFAVLFACLIFSLGLPAAQSEAQTRRAFLVGNQDYKDGNIQQLKRAANDARDLAKDLEELGFDKKNIKVALDVKNKNAFDKEFEAFLKTVETGDLVFFYFSEPIREVLESDESDVIPCWALDSRRSAACGHPNIAALRTAAACVIRAT